MNKKMVCGVLLTVIGLVYSVVCFIYAAMNPWVYNGIDGVLGSFLGTGTLVWFIVTVIVMCAGLVICFMEAFRKEK